MHLKKDLFGMGTQRFNMLFSLTTCFSEQIAKKIVIKIDDIDNDNYDRNIMILGYSSI